MADLPPPPPPAPPSGGGSGDSSKGNVLNWIGQTDSFNKRDFFDITLQTLRFGAPVDVTIASNAITVTSSNHNITATGTLNTINAWDSAGMMVLLTADAAVTIAHAADNILCWGDQNITVDAGDMAILFRPDPTSGNYVAMGDTFSSSSHTQSHTITNTADHTSGATSGQILQADANGLPVDASNTNAELASVVSSEHSAAHGSAQRDGYPAALARTHGAPPDLCEKAPPYRADPAPTRWAFPRGAPGTMFPPLKQLQWEQVWHQTK